MPNLVHRFYRSSLEACASAGQSLWVLPRVLDWDEIRSTAGDTLPRNEGMEILVNDLNQSACLTPLGRALARRKIISTLENRVQLETHLAAQNGTFGVDVEQPVFVTGFPRTGTTLLHRLLAAHPDLRTPQLWEVLRPLQSSMASAAERDRLRREAGRLRFAMHILSPESTRIHPMHPTAPGECQHILESTFVAPFFVFYHVPRYQHWMEQLQHEQIRDACITYRHFVEGLLRNSHRKRFLSKAPSHAYFGAALPETFAGMCVVRTHRDPMQSIPSLASLITKYRSIFSGSVDKQQIGRLALQIFHISAARQVAMDVRLRDRQAIDVPYTTLQQRPVETAIQILADLDLEVSDSIRNAVALQFAKERHHGHVQHAYSLQEFGLDERDVATSLEFYVDWLEERTGIRFD